jgi:hypothetical protein
MSIILDLNLVNNGLGLHTISKNKLYLALKILAEELNFRKYLSDKYRNTISIFNMQFNMKNKYRNIPK